MNPNFSIKEIASVEQYEYQSETYTIMMVEGEGSFVVDLVTYSFSGKIAIFLNPFQGILFTKGIYRDLKIFCFKAEFYCIEYHRQDVACNGLLFNNIYQQPYIGLTDKLYMELQAIFERMKEENNDCDPYSASVLKTYLQLILALCSKEKKRLIGTVVPKNLTDEVLNFQDLVEEFYRKEHSISFYADKFGLTTDAFNRKIKNEIGKTPKQILQDRIILEAKKLLQLTQKSVKEISWELAFDDEFYFSRYFKKNVGVSPLKYRESTKIG